MKKKKSQDKSYWVDTKSFDKIKDITIENNHVVYHRKRSLPTWSILAILVLVGFFGYMHIKGQKVLIINDGEKTKNYVGTWKYEKDNDNELLLTISNDGNCSLKGKTIYNGNLLEINQSGKCYTNLFYNKFMMEKDNNEEQILYEKWTSLLYQNDCLKIDNLEFKKQ